jgi:hypothetical protein
MEVGYEIVYRLIYTLSMSLFSFIHLFDYYSLNACSVLGLIMSLFDIAMTQSNSRFYNLLKAFLKGLLTSINPSMMT